MMRLRIASVLIVAVAVSVICAAVWKFNTSDGDPKTREFKRETSPENRIEKQYMQFDDWSSGKFRSKTFHLDWVSDTEYSSLTEERDITLTNADTNVTDVLLDKSAWKSLTDPASFTISGDQKFVAITYGLTTGYPHYMAFYSVAIFQTSNSTRIDLSAHPLDNIQTFKWDPVGHNVAFVRNFDVYVMTDFSVPVRVTDDGKENVKFNGIGDWLFYGYITDDSALLWWAPDGKHLVYATLNETNVKIFDFASFGGKTYPEMISFPYPKPGTPIPRTQVYVFDPESGNAAIELVPSDKVKGWGDFYLNSAIWRDNITYSPTWKNRFGNESVSESCTNHTGSWICDHVSMMERESTSGWLGHFKPAGLVATPLGYEYMTVLSDDAGFSHLVVVDAANNIMDWRTSGNFEVTDTYLGFYPIHFYDSANDWVYFTSTESPNTPGTNLPRIRHMWRVKGHGEDRNRECITCDLNNVYPDRCNWVSPTFSPGGTFVVVNCGGTENGVPISTLHKIATNGTVGEPVVAENNDDLQNNLNAFHFRTREYGSIELPDVPGEKFYYTLHKPPNFNENKKYPMLVQVYSGPGFQHATDSYNADWARGYIASSDLNIVVMTFDGRGTGFRGDRIMHMVYRTLGEYEPIDQIEAAKQIASKYPFINSSQIAIWGRSYGGYATARTIAEDENNVFKCGISVAPVTDWLTYHTVYTEKYMGSPFNDNEIGYKKSSAIQKLHNFGKHYFVLVHGTSDANVHFLNGARLSKALIEADVDFSSYFAADENHSFTKYPNGYAHHYKLLTHHLKICFGIE